MFEAPLGEVEKRQGWLGKRNEGLHKQLC